MPAQHLGRHALFAPQLGRRRVRHPVVVNYNRHLGGGLRHNHAFPLGH